MNRVEEIEARLKHARRMLVVAKRQEWFTGEELERAEKSFLVARRQSNNAKAKVQVTAGRVEVIELELELELDG